MASIRIPLSDCQDSLRLPSGVPMRLSRCLAVTAMVAAVVAAPVSIARASTAPVVTVSSTTTVAVTAPGGVPFATSANAQVGVAAWGEGTGSASVLKSVVVRANGATTAPTSGTVGSIPACGTPAGVECVTGAAPESMEVSMSADGTVVAASWRAGGFFEGYRGYVAIGRVSGSAIAWAPVRDLGRVAYPGVSTALSSDGTRVVVGYRTNMYDEVNSYVCLGESLQFASAAVSGSTVVWGEATTLIDVDSCPGSGQVAAIDSAGSRALVAWSVTDSQTDEIGLQSWAIEFTGPTVSVGNPSTLADGFTIEWLTLSSDGRTAMAAGYEYGAQYTMDYFASTARLAVDGTTTWDGPKQFADNVNAIWMTSTMSANGSTGAVAWTTGSYNPDQEIFEGLSARILPISIANGVATVGTSVDLGAVSALTVRLTASGSRVAIGTTSTSGGAVRVGTVASGVATLASPTSLTSEARANHVSAGIAADGTSLLMLWRGESGQNTPLYARGATVGASASAPTITGLSPAFGKADATTAVTITGTGFVSGATVTVAGKAATVTSVNSTTIRVTVPTGTKGNATVVVRNPNAQQATTQFTYLGKSTRTVTFSGSSVTLSQSARSTAQSTATTIKDVGGRFVVVTGFAAGTTAAARTTATNRANAVATILRGQGLTVTTATKTGAKETARAVMEWYS